MSNSPNEPVIVPDNAGAPPHTTAALATTAMSREEREQLQSPTSARGRQGSVQSHPGNSDTAPVVIRETEAEQTIDELLEQVVVHSHAPIENLPPLTLPELKIIGRCVTFSGETTFNGERVNLHYEGLVATISRDTVTLIHVHRYTKADFELHRLEGSDVLERDANMLDKPLDTVAVIDEAVTHSNGDVGDLMGGQEGLSSLAKDVGETHREATKRVRNKLKGNTGSMGPIPYMTFTRSRIHDVQFARDPRSSFYTLFRDPTREFFDMQCLRMFVRRFIVHTSQGNNPRQIPLRAFVTCRCACPDLDNDLLLRVTLEEIGHLVRVERAMRRAKRAKSRSEVHSLRLYVAPPGMFQSTGVLYLTRIPRHTFLVAVLDLAMTIAFTVYAASVFTASPTRLLYVYASKYIGYVCGVSISSVAASVVTAIHSTRMRVPLSSTLGLSLLRVFFVTASLACCLMSMTVLGKAFTLTNVRKYVHAEADNLDLCGYFYYYNCSGFDTRCFNNESASLCSGCSDLNYTNRCRDTLMGNVERSFIPLLCFALVLFIVLCVDQYLHYKVFHVARLLMRGM